MSMMAAPARSLVRQTARQQLAVRASVASSVQKRNASDDLKSTTASSYTSPFRGISDHLDTTKIPSFKKYRNQGGENSGKVFQYFMVGTMGAVSAMGAKNTVQGRHTTILI